MNQNSPVGSTSHGIRRNKAKTVGGLFNQLALSCSPLKSISPETAEMSNCDWHQHRVICRHQSPSQNLFPNIAMSRHTDIKQWHVFICGSSRVKKGSTEATKDSGYKYRVWLFNEVQKRKLKK